MSRTSVYKSAAGEQQVAALYHSLLARWPVPYEAMELATRYGPAFAIACGPSTGPAVVLLHGAGTNSAMWIGEIEKYSQSHRAFMVDLPGEAGRSARVRPAWRGPAYTEWLEDVMAGLHVDEASFVGVSQGGWVALKFALGHPQRVKKLVLLAPAGIVPDRLGFVFRALPLSWMGRWGARRINRLVLSGQPVSTEVEDALTTITTHFRPRLGVVPDFIDAELRSLKMPVLLLIGARDALRDAEGIVKRMKKLVPDVKAVVEANGGHALLNTAGHVLPFLANQEDTDIAGASRRRGGYGT